MKNFLILLALGLSSLLAAQEIKSKNLKIKYSTPAGWTAKEFGGKSPWEDAGNNLCKCAGVSFSKMDQNGTLNVVVYPSTQSGLDSAKRNSVGPFRFENVVKFDKIKNKNFSFERKRSNFIDAKTNKKSYEVLRYFAKAEDHFYIIYAWQENNGSISPDTEKALYEVINAIEPN